MKSVLPDIAAFADEMTAWRRHLHQHPELDLACHATAAFVAERMTEFGVDHIHTGFAQTGIVAIIEGRGAGLTIGLRADMDALPIIEATGAQWQSKTTGIMPACGHDDHTTMLLGAARYLCQTRNFSGRVVLIFQPGEELSGGGQIMVAHGIFDRFDIAEIYALHTLPGETAGTFHTRPGPFLASVDDFSFTITGRSGHVAYPALCRNPINHFGAVIAGVASI
ncbi:amidohydrolase [Roseobacter weihaiensis]|uniref:amidohydrolase n=1 Tax=Roseobacter weihaiensis TaxID=2763262 RepID=UPI0029CAAC05|nr:amidohydrolase [Roseobacter sp. H9]